MLNDAAERLAYYRRVIAAAEAEARTRPDAAPTPVPVGLLPKGTCR